MPREVKTNRFSTAGQALVESAKEKETETKPLPELSDSVIENAVLAKKTKAATFKIKPETWKEFTMLCKAQGMTNGSVINMLISKYVRDNKEEILK